MAKRYRWLLDHGWRCFVFNRKRERILEEGKTLKASNIKENESISAKINFNPAIQSFHLVINDKEYKTGLPTWIVYESIDDNSGKITFNGITRDYTIEVIIDEDIFVESK